MTLTMTMCLPLSANFRLCECNPILTFKSKGTVNNKRITLKLHVYILK